ncbi:MAG: MMPL family transporter [Gemmatimonadota bacterium]
MEPKFRRLARLICRYYRAVLILAAAVTALCSYPTYQIARRLETDFSALLPDDYPSVEALKAIKRRVRGTENMIVLVETRDSLAAQRFAGDLAAELGREEYRPYVNYVDYRRDVDFYRHNALLYMDLGDLKEIDTRVADWIDEEKAKLSPLYVALDGDEGDDGLSFADVKARYEKPGTEDPYYVNGDRHLLALTVAAAGTASNVGFGRQMEAALRQAVAHLDPTSYATDMRIDYGGSFRNKIDEYDTIRHDVTSTLIYGILGVVLLLTVYFRQPLAVVVTVLPLAMGLTWTFTVAWWAVGNLNSITGFLFVILFGLGIDFGIHLFARYLEDRLAGDEVEVAVEKMMSQAGPAVLTAGWTTVAAFYALTLTDFKGFSEFGLIVGTGVIASMVAMLTVLPALLLLVDGDLGLIRRRPVWGHGANAVRGAFPRARLVAVLGLGSAAALALLVPRVQFEYDFTNLRANLPGTRAVKEKLESVPGYRESTQSPAVVLADSRGELEEVVGAVEARMAAPDSTPTIASVRTLWTALPAQQEEKLAVIARLRQRVENEAAHMLKPAQQEQLDEVRSLLDVGPVDVPDLPEGARRRFRTVDGEMAYMAFIYSKVPLRDGRKAMQFADDAETIETRSGKVYHSSSSGIVFADVLRVMLRDTPRAIVLALVVVLGIVLADFRSLRQAALVVLPLVCGMAWMLGVMQLLGMKLNLFNIVTLPSVIGMGIDSGVHVYHRYREAGPGSLPMVLRRTGGAMLICVLTTMVGFGGLIGARHPGLQSIGELALLGLATCFVAAVTVLPAVLQLIERRSQTEPARS